MNFSQSSSIENESDCKSFFLRYPLTDSGSYGSLIIAAVLSSIACPFTIFLNALAMVAVKIKRRLQTHPNILLACMAVTDLLVGLVVQPLYITKTIFLLQGKGFHEFCDIEDAFTVSFTISSTASLLHLVLISGERYLAVNHTFTHASVVTKTRLVVSSAVAWIITGLSLLVSSYFPFLTPLLVAVSTAAIVVLQLLVYKEARRHEKQILSQQISLEARAKFENDKALKLTTIIITVIFLCIFVPYIALVFIKLFVEFFSSEIKKTARQLFFLLVMLNSVLNPVIYSVRARQFRVAFIELLLRKSFQEAEQFQRKLFGPRHNDRRIPEDGQESHQREQNDAGRILAVQANQHQANGPVVLVPGAIFDENDATWAENEPISSNAAASTFNKAEEELSERRNPVAAKQNEEDELEVFVLGRNIQNSHTTAAQNDTSNNICEVAT